MTPEDIRRIRNDTPACEKIAHFNNAGASLMPDPVVNAVTSHLELERQVGGYEAAERAADQLDRFYTSIASILGARSDEIAFAENATRAWDMAVYALPLEEGDRILTHASEYGSNYLAFLHLQKRRGVEIDLIPSDTTGQVDVTAIPELILPKTKVLALTHVPMHDGLVHPVEAAGQLAKKYGLTFVLDSCQAVGQLPIDVQKIGCHILAGTGRKFLRGPRGTGFLYIATDLAEALDPPFIDIQSADWTGPDQYTLAAGARRFETWERNVAGMLGLTAAADYAMSIGLEAIERRIAELADTLRTRLTGIQDITVRDQGTIKSGIVTFEHKSTPAKDIASCFQKENIYVSVPQRHQALLDFSDRNLSSLVRASVHYFNTDAEIDRLCSALKDIR